MCYKLRLTIGERKAIDWVGDRYAHGNDLWEILTDTHDWEFHTTQEDDDTDWGWLSDVDITFTLQEYQAWAIQGIAEECNHQWDCFAPELVAKLETLLGQIV